MNLEEQLDALDELKPLTRVSDGSYKFDFDGWMAAHTVIFMQASQTADFRVIGRLVKKFIKSWPYKEDMTDPENFARLTLGQQRELADAIGTGFTETAEGKN